MKFYLDEKLQHGFKTPLNSSLFIVDYIKQSDSLFITLSPTKQNRKSISNFCCMGHMLRHWHGMPSLPSVAQNSVGTLSSPGLLTLLLVASIAAQAQFQKAESLLNKVRL